MLRTDYYIKHLFYLLLSGFFYSCISEVDLDGPPAVNTLAINSIINPQDTFYVQVSKPVAALENQFEFVSDTEVNLKVAAGNSYPLVFKDDYYYLAGFEYLENQAYSIEVKDRQSGISYSAQTFTPKIQIWSVKDFQFNFATDSEGDDLSAVEITFHDDPLRENFYGVRIISHHKFIGSERLHSELLGLDSKDPVIQNEGISLYATQNLVFSDVLLSDGPYHLSIDFGYGPSFGYNPPFYSQSYLVVEFYTLSESLYQYIKSYLVHDFNQEPFNGYELINFFESNEPVNLYSNIEGGLGVFGAFTVTRDTIYVNPD